MTMRSGRREILRAREILVTRLLMGSGACGLALLWLTGGSLPWIGLVLALGCGGANIVILTRAIERAKRDAASHRCETGQSHPCETTNVSAIYE